MGASTLNAYWAAVRTDFKAFLEQAFDTLLPGTPFLDNWHIDAIVYQLERGLKGQTRRLIINMPPRHLKSLIVTIAWPAYVMGRDPTAKFICVSYSDELSRSHAREFRRLVESDWYRAVFPEVRLTKSTESEVVTDRGGYRYATSVGGTLTGRGADFIIIDDPIKPDDAASDRTREGVNEWFRTTLLSRLNDKHFSVLILVMQRICVNDLTGYLEGQGGFVKLALAAIARKDESVATGPGLDYFRKAGEALHPARESLEVLDGVRNSQGPGVFNAQYQQAPEAPEGNLFKRKYFNVIDRYPSMDVTRQGALFLSIDSALSTAITADYTAMTLVLGLKGNFYVLLSRRGRWDYEELKKKVWHYIKEFGTNEQPLDVIVENAGSGVALLTGLRHASIRGDGRFRVFSYTPRDDKFVRASRALDCFARGHVFICNVLGSNDWVEPFINEFLCFPNGKFDDQVDSLVQLLINRRQLALSGAWS